MIQVCRHCGSEIRDTARYCDQCGRPQTDEAVAPQAPASQPSTQRAANLRPLYGLVALLVVLGGLYFLLKPAAGGGDGAAPMGGGEGPMKDVLAKVEGLKKKLKESPGDTATIAEMYGLYAQVGKTDQVTPHLEAALAELEKTPEQEGIREKIAELAEGAMSAGDNEGLLKCLEAFHRIFPADTGAIGYLGDQCFRMGLLEESIAWYDKFLEQVDAHKQSDDYYGVYASRASTRIELFRKTEDAAALNKALEELEDLTTQQAQRWSGWYYYGEALQERGDKVTARQAFATSQERAVDGFQRWQSEAAIAKLDGKPEPPMPNPHGEMPGGMPGAEGQMPNDSIHGGGGAAEGQMPDDDIHRGAGGAEGQPPDDHNHGGSGSSGT